MRKIAIVTIWGKTPQEDAVFDTVHNSFDEAVAYVVRFIVHDLEMQPSFTVKGINNNLNYTTISYGIDGDYPVHFDINEYFLEN